MEAERAPGYLWGLCMFFFVLLFTHREAAQQPPQGRFPVPEVVSRWCVENPGSTPPHRGTREPAREGDLKRAPRYRPFPRSEPPPVGACACAYTITYSRLVVRTSSHSLFVRCSRVVRTSSRTLLAHCSYAARTSSDERELTRELRTTHYAACPLWCPSTQGLVWGGLRGNGFINIWSPPLQVPLWLRPRDLSPTRLLG